MLHGHGDDAYRHGDAVRLNFSSNVRPGGAPAALRTFLAGRIADIGSYPEVAAETLAARLAARHDVAPENIIVTNGAVAGIYLIAQAWAGARSVVVTPTFSEYEDAARQHSHGLRFARWGDDAFPDADLVWLCNPNNPTGSVLPRDTVLAMVDAHPRVTFVIDLAYADFCAAEPLRATDVTRRRNLLLVRSQTKTHGLPGLRLGHLVMPAGLRARLAPLRQPWSVNSLALAAGLHCLEHEREFALPLADLLRDAARLAAGLDDIAGIRTRPTATTFVLFELDPRHGTAAALKTELVARHGMLVRDASNFRGLGPGAVRVATQGAAADACLLDAIRGHVGATPRPPLEVAS